MRQTATTLLASQETLRLLRSPGPYLLLALVWAAVSLTVRSYLKFVISQGVVVSNQPLAVPVALAAMCAALYVGLIASTSICREREMGSLEVLFTAPIRPTHVVRGYFLAYTGVGGALMLISTALLAVAGLGAGLELGLIFGLQVAAAAVSVAEVVALGLLLSSGARRVRTAILLLLGLFAILGSLYVGATFLTAQAQPDTWAYYSQQLLASVLRVLPLVSPIDLVTRVTSAATGGQLITAALWLVAGLVRTILWLGGARSLLQRVGVRP